jgi:predicted Zn-dependent protease
MTSKSKGLIWIILIVCAVIYFSNFTALLFRLVPRSFERKMAERVKVHFHPDLCINSDAKTQKALKKFLARLFPIAGLDDEKDFQLNIRFIHSDQVNAYAALGGEIYVLSGLLRNVDSPEELAGVIAHEMAHQKERHILQGIFSGIIIGGHSLPDTFFKIAFTKGEEHEADVLGLNRLKAAKIDASGFIHFFNKREDAPTWVALISDHPGNDFRKTLAQTYLGLPSTRILEKEEWALLKNYCR